MYAEMKLLAGFDYVEYGEQVSGGCLMRMEFLIARCDGTAIYKCIRISCARMFCECKKCCCRRNTGIDTKGDD